MAEQSALEYTFEKIHETASRLARITETPHVGLASYLQSVHALMRRLRELEVVQEVGAMPDTVTDRNDASRVDPAPAVGRSRSSPDPLSTSQMPATNV